MIEKLNVLDKGFVRVVDKMGSDEAIVQSARISYGSGTKKTSQDRGLIRYLMRHMHTSPFEMCEIKFHIKLPIFVARQWVRHRTANVNEYSARYSIVEDEFYIPSIENISLQSVDNKQGRGQIVSKEEAEEIRELLIKQSDEAYKAYQHMLEKGIARELARVVLPQNVYTQMYWKIDLHNLLHFIKLRSHSTAQFEIREFSKALEKIVEEWLPITYEAFVDYKLESVNVSRVLRPYLKRQGVLAEELGITEEKEFEEFWPLA